MAVIFGLFTIQAHAATNFGVGAQVEPASPYAAFTWQDLLRFEVGYRQSEESLGNLNLSLSEYRASVSLLKDVEEIQSLILRAHAGVQANLDLVRSSFAGQDSSSQWSEVRWDLLLGAEIFKRWDFGLETGLLLRAPIAILPARPRDLMLSLEVRYGFD